MPSDGISQVLIFRVNPSGWVWLKTHTLSAKVTVVASAVVVGLVAYRVGPQATRASRNSQREACLIFEVILFVEKRGWLVGHPLCVIFENAIKRLKPR